MPTISWPRSRSLRPDLDRACRTPVQRVVGVDEEDAVVGHRLGVRRERLGSSSKRHDPAVGVGAPHRDAEQLAGEHVRGRRAAADVGGARSRRAPPSIPCARRSPNSSTGSPFGGEADARRLGGDQGLEVDQVEQRRLQELSLEERAADPQQRLVREHHRALGHGVDVAREAQRREVVEERRRRRAARRRCPAGPPGRRDRPRRSGSCAPGIDARRPGRRRP